MRMKGGIEQAVCILLRLAKQETKQAIKSSVLSDQLGVSDSYLKKMMRELVLANIVTSGTGNGGGFMLYREPNEITMLDIYQAIEGQHSFIYPTMSENRSEHHENNSLEPFFEAESLFLQKLKQSTLQDLLEEQLKTA